MKRKKDDHVAHELRDRPVPPVKGAVTEPEDVVIHPRAAGNTRPVPTMEDTIVFNGWL